MIKNFIKYYKPYKRLFILDMIAALLFAVCDLVYPIITRNIMNEVVPKKDLRMLVVFAITLVVIFMLKASLNPLCKSATDQLDKIMNSSQSTCNNNYLFEVTEPTLFWSINAFGSESGAFRGNSDSANAWIGARYSGLTGLGPNNAYDDVRYGARPVLYLKSNISLEGEGTQSDPFTIS